MKPYRVAVTGGRDHEITEEEAEKFADTLSHLEWASFPSPCNRGNLPRAVLILHGNCRGVDRRAAQLAEEWGYHTVPFEAPWDLLGALTRDCYKGVAGPLRNWMMIQAADLLIAFPGGRGTADCVRQAEKKGVEVVRVGGGG